MNKLEENKKELERIINSKMEDIVNLLELFQGQLSLTDILNQDIPILNGLRQAKNRINGEIQRERERQQGK